MYITLDFFFSRWLREYYCTTKKPQHYTQLFRAYVKDTWRVEGMVSDAKGQVRV